MHSGKHIKTARLKDLREVVIRHPTEADAAEMLEFINTLSSEDTFITFSGEQLTLAEEQAYLSSVLKGMEDQNMILVLAFLDGKLAGSVTINRDLKGRKRTYHRGVFGITIARKFRTLGLGEILARTVIDEARTVIPGLRIITLSVYLLNEVAQSLYKKLGFKEYGRIPEGVLYRGEYIDEVQMYLEVA